MKVRRSKNCKVRSESRGKDIDEASLRNWLGWIAVGGWWVSEKGVRYGLGVALDYGPLAWALD